MGGSTIRRRPWPACAALGSAVLCASAPQAQASVTQRHVSQWVFDTLPITGSVPPLPACGSVLEEPCRTNAEPVPGR